MIHVGSCSEHARANLLALAKEHQQLIAHELRGSSRPEVIFYSVLQAQGTDPRLSPAAQALLTQVMDEVTEKAYRGEPKQVLLAGFLEAPPGCCPQCWHVDYDGNTDSLFVPLVPMTDGNGTEYVEWESAGLGLQMLAKYGPRLADAHILDFARLAPTEPYRIRRAVADPFTILRMPHYLFHRGVRNDEDYTRVVFYMTVAATVGFELSEDYQSPVMIPHTTNSPAAVDTAPGP